MTKLLKNRRGIVEHSLPQTSAARIRVDHGNAGSDGDWDCSVRDNLLWDKVLHRIREGWELEREPLVQQAGGHAPSAEQGQFRIRTKQQRAHPHEPPRRR